MKKVLWFLLYLVIGCAVALLGIVLLELFGMTDFESYPVYLCIVIVVCTGLILHNLHKK